MTITPKWKQLSNFYERPCRLSRINIYTSHNIYITSTIEYNKCVAWLLVMIVTYEYVHLLFFLINMIATVLHTSRST